MGVKWKTKILPGVNPESNPRDENRQIGWQIHLQNIEPVQTFESLNDKNEYVMKESNRNPTEKSPSIDPNFRPEKNKLEDYIPTKGADLFLLPYNQASYAPS